MPLAYNTPYMKKVIVLMTDGNNEWYDWTDGVPGEAAQGDSNDDHELPPMAMPTSRPMAAC